MTPERLERLIRLERRLVAAAWLFVVVDVVWTAVFAELGKPGWIVGLAAGNAAAMVAAAEVWGRFLRLHEVALEVQRWTLIRQRAGDHDACGSTS